MSLTYWKQLISFILCTLDKEKDGKDKNDSEDRSDENESEGGDSESKDSEVEDNQESLDGDKFSNGDKSSSGSSPPHSNQGIYKLWSLALKILLQLVDSQYILCLGSNITS